MSETLRNQTDGEPPSTHRLEGRLGTAAIVLMVVAAAAPLTTLGGNVPLMITLGEGVGAPVGFLIAGVVFILFASGYVAMTPHVREAGAFYAYVGKGLGTRAGMGSAFVAYAAYMSTLLAVYGYIGAVASNLIDHFGGPSVSWWICSAAIIALVAFLGYRHIDLSAKVLGVFLVSEIAIVVVLDLAIFAQGGSDGITGDSFSSTGINGGLGVAILFALFGFVGVEATAVFRDEAKDPDRTIPRATYWSVGIIALFYAVSSWAVIEGNGGSAAVAVATDDPDNFIVNTAQTFLGMLGRDITLVLLSVSLFAAALSFHNITSRYQFILAQHGVLPRSWGEVHPAHQAPSRSSLVVSVTSAVAIAAFALFELDPLLQIFGPMGGIGIAGLASLWLLTSISIAVYFSRRTGAGRTVGVAIAAVIALTGSLYLIVKNLPLIVGGTQLLAIMMGCIPVIFFVAGFTVAATRKGSTRVE